MTKDLLGYLQGHSCRFITSNQTGVLSNRLSQVTSIQPILSILITAIGTILMMALVQTAILMWINVWLAVCFVIGAFLSYGVNTVINKKAEHLSEINGQIESVFSGRLVDVIANLRLVKMFNRLKYEQEKIAVVLKQQFDNKKKELRVGLSVFTLAGIFVNLCSIMLICFAVYLWSIQKIDLSDIVFVLLTLNTGFRSLMELYDAVRQLRNLLAYASEGLKPFAIEHEIKDAHQAVALKNVNGEIEFSHVGFAYSPKKTVFKDFNLKIKPKEKIGIVGLSGSGKTTLINLLQRFYLPQNGKIMIDMQNIDEVTSESLADNIAVISQENLLFCRTIMQNIGYGNLQATEKQIIRAAEKAQADGFIRHLESGYATKIGERGVKLSGGEKQRIAIARAILKDAPILILDEATSALDSESEYKISQAVAQMMKGKTVIAIAHRLSTLKQMDRIIVMAQGKIVEEGTPEELLDKGGNFARLWNLQMQ